MKKIIKRSELIKIIDSIKETQGNDTAEQLGQHIKSLEHIIKDKNQRIQELTALIKRFRTEFIRAQSTSDIYKRNYSYFENIAKEYGMEIDLSFDEEIEILTPEDEVN